LWYKSRRTNNGTPEIRRFNQVWFVLATSGY